MRSATITQALPRRKPAFTTKREGGGDPSHLEFPVGANEVEDLPAKVLEEQPGEVAEDAGGDALYDRHGKDIGLYLVESKTVAQERQKNGGQRQIPVFVRRAPPQRDVCSSRVREWPQTTNSHHGIDSPGSLAQGSQHS